MSSEKTCYLIFATDGKGTTQLAHTYAETFEQASSTATRWRDENHPDLRIIRVRVEPNGFLIGPAVSVEVTEEKEKHQ